MAGIRIDHLILATSDLDAAAARLEAEHGLRATGGGRHDGLGTHNRIVPLADGFIELLAVADPEEAERSPLGRAVTARLRSAGEGLAGWVVEVDDVEAVARRLGTEVTAISRQGMTARLTGVAQAAASPCLPFFISRDEGIPDPGAGATGAIEWVEVAGDPRTIEAWLGDAELPVRITEGEPALLAAGVSGRVLR